MDVWAAEIQNSISDDSHVLHGWLEHRKLAGHRPAQQLKHPACFYLGSWPWAQSTMYEMPRDQHSSSEDPAKTEKCQGKWKPGHTCKNHTKAKRLSRCVKEKQPLVTRNANDGPHHAPVNCLTCTLINDKQTILTRTDYQLTTPHNWASGHWNRPLDFRMATDKPLTSLSSKLIEKLARDLYQPLEIWTSGDSTSSRKALDCPICWTVQGSMLGMLCHHSNPQWKLRDLGHHFWTSYI